MYIIAYNNGANEAIVAGKDVFSLATLLENAKIRFTVSNRAGKVTADQFGYGEFKYWRNSFK